MNRKQKRILFRIVIAAVLSSVVYIIPINGFLKLFMFLIPYFIVGYDVLFSAVRNIIRGQLLDENFLMSLATVGAFCISEYTEAVAVMLFYQIGELFQSIAVGRSRKSIADLMDLSPETACVLRADKEITVSPQEVLVGETVIIKAGERIPLDGVIIKGSTTVDTSSLTGESVPRELKVGDSVISGTVNLSGVILVKTVSVYEDSTVAKILELTENAAENKAVTENFITRFARYYTPVVVICALILAVVPPLFTGEFAKWINRALIFLVVSCPCALVVSVPLTFFGGIGGASKNGILFKGASCLERLAEVDTVVFDKTGTLTQGKFTVTEVISDNISKEELLKIAASAEAGSNHPIAQSIVETVNKKDLESFDEIIELSGMGIECVYNGSRYYIGNSALMDKVGIAVNNAYTDGTCVHIACEDGYLGTIVVNDTVKPNACKAVNDLKISGIKNTVMLTGDNYKTAEKIANNLRIDSFSSELLPADKVKMVEEWLKKGNKAAFVGDGINDAPVLTRADVGIAMGAMGSDAAVEAADIVIMDDNLEKLANAINISKRTMSIVKQNIVFALGVKGAVLILGALGFANMWIAVFGDVGVTVIAILNAMRTLKIKRG